MPPLPPCSPPVPDHQFIQVTLVIGFLILSLGIHEAAHAWAAYRLGDDTAEKMGRMTLNPIPHIDPFLTILLPAMLYFSTNGAFVFGGAKPVPVFKQRLRKPNRDMALVAIAGPASNLILAVIFTLAWKGVHYGLDYSPDDLAVKVLGMSAVYNVVLAVFNLIPIPPLDGSRVMAYMLPPNLREPYVSLERIGMLLVIGFIWFLPGGRDMLGEAIGWAIDQLDVLTGGRWT